MFSISHEQLLNRQFRDFFFFRLKDREEEDDKIKGIHTWGKTKDEGVRATIPLIFFLFQLEY